MDQRFCTDCGQSWRSLVTKCPACGSRHWCAYLPTPREIRSACAALQATWTPAMWYDKEATHAIPVDMETARVSSYLNGRVVRLTMGPT